MHGRNLALWCCTVLLVASSSESRANSTTWSNDEQNNSTVRYEIHANVLTMNHSDDAGLLRYNVHKNSTMDNDDVHANYTSNDRKDGDSVQYEFDAHSMKNHSGGNQTPMVLRANSTKVDDKNNSTSLRHELSGNLTQVEDRNNLMLSELLEEFNEDKKKNVVPYEMCSNSTCIPLCCPLGNSFIKEECIAGKGNYPFPDVYEHASNDSEETSGKRPKLDEIFQLTVYDPCKLGRYLLNRVDCPQDEHRFLANGSLYLPHSNNIVESYCLAVIHGNKYEVSVCFPIDEVVETDGIPVGAVGMTVSLPFLLTTFVVYSILPELWNMHGYTLRGYVGSLFVAYIFLVTFQLTPQAKISDSICIAAAFIIHFSFLASFFWLNVMCFDIWWTFGGFRSLQGSVNQRERKKFVMYSIYAWGSASIFTIICATMDFVPSVPKEFIRPEFGAESCWFRTDKARALYFYGPMTVTVVCNICLFISTALKIIRHKKDTAHHLRGSESRRHDDNKQWFNLYLKLFIVMGINWSMEIVSWLFENAAPKYVWYLTDLTNALQGLIIFIIFVWKEKIKRLLLKKFGCQGRGPFSNNSTRSVYHSSASRTCTTTTSTVIPLQEKISPYVQTNCRTKSSSDEADP